jgi:hypothetical protein
VLLHCGSAKTWGAIGASESRESAAETTTFSSHIYRVVIVFIVDVSSD